MFQITKIIKSSQRSDGTWRPEIEIKAGYIPKEEAEVYTPKGIEANLKNHEKAVKSSNTIVLTNELCVGRSDLVIQNKTQKVKKSKKAEQPNYSNIFSKPTTQKKKKKNKQKHKK
ncbi:hypothetical protein A3Q56_04110 [Intoshia linei]|uniref:WIBG Mago-binding domain-containing protein n=1 Tax=Intoshia linei TaxID=1819745 RepID=A0A177B129_9BILA|nr:hypothetical protein A3Q56_04110 [Intoshia linei]